MPLQDVIKNVVLRRTVQKVCLGLKWTTFPQVIKWILRSVFAFSWTIQNNNNNNNNNRISIAPYGRNFRGVCLAAIECFVVIWYMTKQASMGLWTTLVSSCSHRKVKHWKTFHQHMMFWCSTASAQHTWLAMSGVHVCLRVRATVGGLWLTITTTVDHAANSCRLLSLLRCACKTGCKTGLCKCIRAKLHCSALCRHRDLSLSPF